MHFDKAQEKDGIYSSGVCISIPAFTFYTPKNQFMNLPKGDYPWYKRANRALNCQYCKVVIGHPPLSM